MTAISPTYYDGRTQKANPYAGHVTSIAIEPGQNIGNIQMGAKVFVSFTEPMQGSAPNSYLRYQDQTKPIAELSADEIAFMWSGEAANWQYSTARHTTTLRNVTATLQTGYGPKKTGDTENVQGRDVVTWTVLTLPFVEVYQNYEEYVYDQFTASNAGWRWLSTPVEIADEDAIQRPVAITAVAEILEPTVSIEVEKEIFATSFIATATLVQPTNYGLPDALSLALPMTAEARMPEVVKIVVAEPMTATASIGQNFTITASGEMVVLTIAHSDAVLYIKEDINN